jgi:hypothetical protein
MLIADDLILEVWFEKAFLNPSDDPGALPNHSLAISPIAGVVPEAR